MGCAASGTGPARGGVCREAVLGRGTGGGSWVGGMGTSAMGTGGLQVGFPYPEGAVDFIRHFHYVQRMFLGG